MKQCTRCRYLNAPDFNFCQRCNTSLGASAAVPRPRPRWLIPTVAGVVVITLASVVGLSLVVGRQAAARRARVEARMAELEGSVRLEIDRANIEGASDAASDAAGYGDQNRGVIDAGRIARLRDLREQCERARDDAGMSTLLVNLSDEDFAAYRKTAAVPNRTYFDDPGINAYYAGALASMRDAAPGLRAAAVRRRNVEARDRAARGKEEAVARGRASADEARGLLAVREGYASTLETVLLDQGIDAYVTVSGPKHSTITIRWVLMSRPTVHQLTNDGETMSGLAGMGFTKVIFTDGYDDTWTYKL